MNSQNTPVHIRLWHHDFWRMAIAYDVGIYAYTNIAFMVGGFC